MLKSRSACRLGLPHHCWTRVLPLFEQDGDWVVVAVPGVELECVAQLRVESENAEITELWIGAREE